MNAFILLLAIFYGVCEVLSQAMASECQLMVMVSLSPLRHPKPVFG